MIKYLAGPGSVSVGVNALQYIASYDDLIAAFGADASAGVNHYNELGYLEGRVESFDGLDYIASYADLSAAFGANAEAGAQHYIQNGGAEHRATTFDGLVYIAGNADLITALGANDDAGAQHYIQYGRAEGRAAASFSSLEYIASNTDLIAAFGVDVDAGARHYIQYGYSEGRATASFDGLQYIASYSDLIAAFGANASAGVQHFIENGYAEGRTTTFAAYEYLASYSDLTAAFGDNADNAAQHFIQYGETEHRTITFDAKAYLDANADVRAAYGDDLEAAARHYIDYGKAEGREAFFVGEVHAPTLSVGPNTTGDLTIPLSISAALTDTQKLETLSVTVSGVPSGATLSAGHDNGDNSWTLSGADLNGLTLSPHGATGTITLSVTATATDSNAAQATTAAETIAATVAPASDAPTLSVSSAGGIAGQAIPLSISVALTDTDSETLGDVLVYGVPSTYTLNHGLLNDEGAWVVPVGQASDLALLATDQSVFGSLTLRVVASSTENGLSTPATTTQTVTFNVSAPAGVLNGQIIDGYVAGATVFADHNGNGVLDAGEVSATTRADGSFTLAGVNAADPLVMFGGTDISTGLPFTGKLTAVGGSTVITPLTTLVQTLVEAGTADAATAEAQVKSAFGLSSSVSLATFDPVAATASGSQDGAAVLAAGIQVQATVAQLSAAGATQADVISTLANTVSSAAPGGVDLSNSDQIASIATTSGIAAEKIDTLKAVTAAANGSIADAVSNGAGTAALADLSQAANVALGSTATAISATDFTDPAATQNLQNNSTGTALTTKVDQAPVGVVTAPFIGTIGNDTIDQHAATASVAIDGKEGADVLIGGAGDDQIFGGAGNDSITGGLGANQLEGGAGVDRAIYSDATAAITADLLAGTVTGAGISDTLVGVEAIRGSAFNDTYTAAGYTVTTHLTAGQTINDQGSFNEFEGLGGDDTITGNGNTRVSYQNALAAVTVDLGSGAHGTASGDAAGIGQDTFVSGVNGVRGSAYDDALTGTNTAGNHQSPLVVEVYEGLAGNDRIDGGGGFDRARYDNFSTGASGITVNMAAGTVTGIDAAATAVVGTDTLHSVEAITGSSAGDIYDARGYTATTNLSAGQIVNDQGSFNEFEGYGGNDTIYGNGNTRLTYLHANAGVIVDLAAGTAHGIAGGDLSGTGIDTFSGVNAVRGTQFADVLRGSSTNGNNTESFDGRGGDDTIAGGAGFDQIRYDGDTVGTFGITVNMAAGTITSTDATTAMVVGNDHFTSIESVIGTYSADTFIATGYTATSNLLSSASDAVLGQTTNDQGDFVEFQGMGGDDTITGNGNTRISYQRAEDGVTVTFTAAGIGTATSTNANDSANVGTDQFTGVNAVRGSNYNDTFTGSSANESFDGLSGDDTIDGGGGNDIIRYDNVTTGTLGITVNMAAGTVSSSDAITAVGVGHDTLRHVEQIRGTNAADTYDATGFSGASTNAGSNGAGNFFEGKGGNDTIIGNGSTGIGYGTASAGVTVDFRNGTSYGTDANDIAGVGQDTFSGVSSVTGSNYDDHVYVVGSASALGLSLGGGTNDTVTLAGTGSPSYSLNLTGVEHVDAVGSANDFLSLITVPSQSATSFTIDTGDGTDTVSLGATGATSWSLGLSHVETLSTSAGNTGNQTVSLTGAVSGLSVDLGAGTGDVLNLYGPSNAVGNTLTVANVETVNGANANNTITFDDSSGATGQVFNFGSGHNVVNLGGSNGTFVFGFSGTDVTLNGRAGDDNVTLTSTVYGNKVIDLGAGNDTLHFASIVGQVNVVTVKNTETIYGGDQVDQITIGDHSGAATVIGGAGADNLTASLGEDHFRFVALTDSTISSGTPASDTVSGFTAGSAAGHDYFDFATALNVAGGAIDYVGNLPGGLTSASINGHAQAFTTAGGNVLQIDLNNDGHIDSAHDMQILLSNLQGTLTAADFHVG